MNWKGTLVLLLLTISVGAYVSLRELKQPTVEEQQSLDRRVVNIPSESVSKIAVKWPQATATLEKTGADWRVTQPFTIRADELLIVRLLNQLSPLDAERVLTSSKDKPLKLAELGLEPPIGTVTVTAADGAHTLHFGETTALGSNRYAKRADDPRVFIVQDGIGQLLNQPVETYRSPDVLVFDPLQVTGIKVESAPSAYTMELRGERWHLTQPLEDVVDAGEASSLLNRLRKLSSERLIQAAPAAEDPAWGFQQPYARVTVTLKDQPTPRVLLIGNPTAEKPFERFAKVGDEPSVHAVAVEAVTELLKPAADLRSRSLFEFFTNQVTKLQATGPGGTWTAEKSAGHWSVPEKQLSLDATKTEQFLWKLSDTKLTKIVEDKPADVAKYGLQPPAGAIQLWTGADQPQEVRIGAPTPDGAARHAWIAGRNIVVEVPASANDLLATTPESLAPAPQASPAANASKP